MGTGRRRGSLSNGVARPGTERASRSSIQPGTSHHPVQHIRSNVSFELRLVAEMMAPGSGRHWSTRCSRYVCSHLFRLMMSRFTTMFYNLTGGCAGRTREFVHLIQMALDAQGLRYCVLDATGKLAHWLEWPMCVTPSNQWTPSDGRQPCARWHARGISRRRHPVPAFQCSRREKRYSDNLSGDVDPSSSDLIGLYWDANAGYVQLRPINKSHILVWPDHCPKRLWHPARDACRFGVRVYHVAPA